MIFNDDKELESIFDIGKKIKDTNADINVLVDEIYRVSVYIYQSSKDKFALKHTDHNGNFITFDKNTISEDVLCRDKINIKQILYRALDKSGNPQKQTSLNKLLLKLGIHEPDNLENYKRYLQLLYLLYIALYFIFPKSKFGTIIGENGNFQNSYEEGTEYGQYLYFIISNLLDDPDLLYYYNFKTNEINYCVDYIYSLYKHLLNNQLVSSEELYELSQNIIIKNSNKTEPLKCFLDYCHNKSTLTMVEDYFDIIKDVDIFKLEHLNFPPYSKWKNERYTLDQIDSLLNSDEFYLYCNQKGFVKVDNKSKRNFKLSNPMKFLKTCIEYDKKNSENLSNLLLLDFDYENNLYIEPLKAATVVISYEYLIRTSKYYIKTRNIKKSITLKKLLSLYESDLSYFPSTVPLTFFFMFCKAMYLNIISENYFDKFYFDIYVLNQLIFATMMEGFKYHSIDDSTIYFKCLISIIKAKYNL